MQKIERKIENRIESIVIKYSIEDAIIRIQGYMEFYFYLDFVRNKLAELHLENGDIVQAGRFFYLKPHLSDVENKCVQKYVSSRGNDIIQIAREQIGHNFKSPKHLSKSVKIKLYKLILRIKMKDNRIPNFAKNWFNHFKKEFPALSDILSESYLF